MKEFLIEHYLAIKALHVIAVIAWMSGMFYLPRLFVYHTETAPGAADYRRFVTMERKLLKIVMNPAMITAWILGLTMAWLMDYWPLHWFQAKLVLVAAMTGAHHAYAIWARDFARQRNTRTARFFRIWNEVPTVLMMGIVILVIVKPF
ncbi:MAG: CopD family protein [Alphaproteobacteria bacterium]|nr:CopD family protein [Alphaproteobacteria bacterium]MDE2109640.1 CopD family protein [Alphaproteobacteria bacterium]MDE2493060.1 CopD family protein [Alphaproteobacteria bacterium]